MHGVLVCLHMFAYERPLVRMKRCMIAATGHRFRLTIVVKMAVRLHTAVHPVMARSACRHGRRRHPLKRQRHSENERDDDSLNARHQQSLVHPAASRSIGPAG